MRRCWCGNSELFEYNVDYYKCEKCHTLVSVYDFDTSIYHVESEEKDLYGKNYWEVSMLQTTGKRTISEVVDMYLSERAIHWLKVILRYIKLGGSIVEIGCGLGQLQYILNRCGYKTKAFELSSEICEYLQKQLLIDVQCGTFEEQEKEYDGILAFDLFEHLVEPEAFLSKCVSNITSNGILCMQMPCYDANLSYNAMKKEKPRFESLLEKEQHVFLYSRESITRILNKYGFSNIIFEPAFFGDDYDMFFVASREPISTNSDIDIEVFLNKIPNGRLIKAMITLFDRNNACTEQYQKADTDRNQRGEQIQKLEKLLSESETDRVARLEQVQELERLLKESEADRAARLEQIETLTKLLQESEADRKARLEQIETLAKLLQESEADRAARLN